MILLKKKIQLVSDQTLVILWQYYLLYDHYDIQQIKKEVGRIKRIYWNIMLKLIETAKFSERMLFSILNTRIEE